MVCVLKPTPSLLVHPPPLYKSTSMTTPCMCDMSEPHPPVYESVVDKDKKLMINVNVTYATVAEHEDGLGQTSDI